MVFLLLSIFLFAGCWVAKHSSSLEVERKAETEGRGLQAQRPLEPQKLEKAGRTPILEPLEDHTTLISGVWSPGPGEDELQLF